MRGAVAAGNRSSAEAGAWALAEGGTCVDAALAATFAAFVTEGPLTGPPGGGFLLLHEPGRDATVLDCFFAVPTGSGRGDGRGRDRLRRRVDPGLPRGRGIRRRARVAPGARGGPRAARQAPLGDALRAGAGARRPSVRRDRHPGVPPRDPHADPPAGGGWSAHLRNRRPDRRHGTRSDAAAPARRARRRARGSPSGSRRRSRRLSRRGAASARRGSSPELR